MGVKRSLSHRQKGVQVYDTQIMICDKRQCSWLRGLATSPYHKRPDTVGQPPRAEIGVPNMLSWKAKKLRKLPQEKVLLEL